MIIAVVFSAKKEDFLIIKINKIKKSVILVEFNEVSSLRRLGLEDDIGAQVLGMGTKPIL